MKFSEELTNATYRITGYGEGWVRVNDQQLDKNFLLTPNYLKVEWSATSLKTLTLEQLEELLVLEAEVIIIGSGSKQELPPAVIYKHLVKHGVGFEIMRTDAACRTYNVLLSEARRVAAAFFL